ncbi:MAG: helix-turn-helix transcriptional regulator [Spirosomataceae bacterium]
MMNMIHNYPGKAKNPINDSGEKVAIRINGSDMVNALNQLISQQISFEIVFFSQEPEPDELPKELVEKSLEQSIKETCGKYFSTHFDTIPSTIDVIATELGINPSTFNKLCRKIYGMPFYKYYVLKKMEYAAALLQSGDKASVVSAKVGYAHPIKFNKMFQKHFGITPKKYQVKHHNVNSHLKVKSRNATAAIL